MNSLRNARPAMGRALMVLALAILAISQVVDWLEPAFGLSVTAVLIAADVVLVLGSGCAVVLERRAPPAVRRAWRRLSLDRARFLNALCVLSLVVLAAIAIAHQRQTPRLDAWLAVVGAVLLPIGGLLATRNGAGRR